MIDSIICCCFLLHIVRMNGKNLTKCSNFGGIPPLTSELAALERLKKSIYKLVSLHFANLLGLLHFCWYQGQLYSLERD